MAEADMPKMTVWNMRFACWVAKARDTHTHTEYVIIIVFPRQQSYRVTLTLPVLLLGRQRCICVISTNKYVAVCHNRRVWF